MTAEELANEIVSDKLIDRVMDAAKYGFTKEELLAGLELLKAAIQIAIERKEKENE